MFIVFTFVEVLHVYFYLLPVQNVDVHYFFVVLGTVGSLFKSNNYRVTAHSCDMYGPTLHRNRCGQHAVLARLGRVRTGSKKNGTTARSVVFCCDGQCCSFVHTNVQCRPVSAKNVARLDVSILHGIHQRSWCIGTVHEVLVRRRKSTAQLSIRVATRL